MIEFSKLVLFAAVASLTFGVPWPDPELAGGRAPFPQDYVVLAADENIHQDQAQSQESASESAKMGEDSGTQPSDEGTTPESETKKVDQLPRQNPTTGN
jgi:hypothetical protein